MCRKCSAGGFSTWSTAGFRDLPVVGAATVPLSRKDPETEEHQHRYRCREHPGGHVHHDIVAATTIDTETSSTILSIATVLGIAGSALATVLGARPSTRTNLLVGYVAMTLSVGLLAGMPGLLRFTVAALLFKLTWTFILPYIMSTLSGLDRSGRVVNLANIAIGGGFAIGPFMGGRLVESAGGYGTLIAVSAAGLVLSLALIMAAQPRRTTAPAATAPVPQMAE
jgi:DHA1 family inner membrane transport protein